MSKKIVTFCVCATVAVVAGVGFVLILKSPATDASTIVNKEQPVNDLRLISKPPKSLVVKAEDLPNAFLIDKGESPAKNEYSHVYFNPNALLDGEQRDYGLLGIIVHIKVLDSLVSAGQEFVDQGGFDLEAVKADISKAIPGAKPISIDPYPLTLNEADKVLAYRVHYLLQGVYVYDYRCRMMVRNVVANVIVSARGSVDVEPADLQKRAVTIILKQRDQLLRSTD